MRTYQQAAEILIELANINSSSTNFQGIKQLIKHLEKFFSPLAAVKRITLPNWEVPCLSLQKRKKAPFQIFFVGHLDTVFPLESHFQACKKLSTKKLQGPGVCDMKGGIVTLLLALEELEKQENKTFFGWQVLLVPDEEIGSIYSKSTLHSFCKGKDLAIVFEPQIRKGVFSRKRKGSLNFHIQVEGEASHAGREPQKGISAIHSLAELVYLLEKALKKTPAVSFNVGRIEGGSLPNVIAKSAFCTLNLRSYSIKSLEKAKSYLMLLTKTTSEKRKVKITCINTSFRPPKLLVQDQKKLHKIAKRSAKKLQMTLDFEDSGGVCDGNEIASMGIPVLDSCGPYGEGIHTTKEWVYLPSIVEQAKLVLEIIFEAALAKNKEIS